MSETTAIYLDDGSTEDSTGDEVREWWVTPGDDDGEPTGKTTAFRSYDSAWRFAELLAEAGRLEVISC